MGDEDVLQQLRAATLGTASRFKKQIVEIGDGKLVEIREPSERVRQKIMEDAQGKAQKNGIGFNLARGRAFAMIHLCYIPDTETKVFEPTDLEMLLNQPIKSGWSAKLGEAAMSMFSGGELGNSSKEEDED